MPRARLARRALLMVDDLDAAPLSRRRRIPAAAATLAARLYRRIKRGGGFACRELRGTAARVGRHSPGTSSRRAPDFCRGFDDEPELRRLRVARNDIAVHGARKAALRRQAKLVERDELRRLVDLALEIILRLQLIELCRNESKDYGLSFRDVTKRREIAGAGVVVFEEIAVDVEVVEKHLRNGLVTALRDPGALEIAPAQMDADGHVRGA